MRQFISSKDICEGTPIKMFRPNEDQSIVFKEEETENLDPKHIDALVVCLKITNSWVKRNLTDNGSLINILYYDGFQRIGLSISSPSPLFLSAS